MTIEEILFSSNKEEVTWLMDITVTPASPATLSTTSTNADEGLICINGGTGPYQWVINSPNSAYFEDVGGTTINLGKICEAVKIPVLSCSVSTIVNTTVTDVLTGETITFDTVVSFENLSWDTERNPTIVLRCINPVMGGPWPTSVNVSVKGGSPPYTWEIISGDQFYFSGYDYEKELITNEKTVPVSAYYDPDHPNDSDYSACGSCLVRITDSCGSITHGAVRCDFGEWAQCGGNWWGDCGGPDGGSRHNPCKRSCSSQYENLREQGFILTRHYDDPNAGLGGYTWDIYLDLGAWKVLHRCCPSQNIYSASLLTHSYYCSSTATTLYYECGLCNCGRYGSVKEFTCPP